MFVHTFFNFSLDFLFDIHNLDFIHQFKCQLFIPFPKIRLTQQFLLISIVKGNICGYLINQFFQAFYLKQTGNRLF